MKVFVGVFLYLTASSVLSQCLYPPCPETGEQHTVHGPEEECCLKNKQELADVQRNISAIWYSLSEFREVVARHLHHLHQTQVQMFTNQQATQAPFPYRRHHPHHHHHHHHHGQHEGADPFLGLKAFTRPPMVRNPEDFDFAVCVMRPNSAVPDSRVQGIVYLSQKKNSETLYLHLMLSGFSTSATHPNADGQPQQEQVFLHGFHVHENPDFSNGCESTGPHLNPHGLPHGGPESHLRHIGDFGNVPSDSEGAINELVTDETASLRGDNSIIGKPLVIHAMEDDLGRNVSDPGSISTGNSGARVACCLIEKLIVQIPSYRSAEVQTNQVVDTQESHQEKLA